MHLHSAMCGKINLSPFSMLQLHVIAVTLLLPLPTGPDFMDLFKFTRMSLLRFAFVFTTTSALATSTLADVQVYGRANVSTDYLHDGQSGGLNVSSNASRIGFRANNQVTDELTAIMQIEQEVRYESGSGTFATRDSFVGVRGEFGTVRLGFMDTPFKVARARVDMFSDMLGDARNMTRVRDNYSGGDFDFDTRFRNGIHYRSPTMNNVTFDLHYSTNTNTGSSTDNDNDAISSALSWQTSEQYLAVAFERKNDTGSQGLRLVGGQSFGDLRINALAQFVTVKGSILAADQDVNTYGLATSYVLAPGRTIKSQLYVSNADGEQRDAQMLAIGYEHIVSPAMRMLFSYAHTRNDSNVRYSNSKGGHGAQITPAPGEDPYGLSVGLRYDF